MRNIKIITIHSIHNFGSVYQSFGLYKYLEKQGYNVEIIDYRPKYLNQGAKKFKTYLGRILNLRQYTIRKNKYEKFIGDMPLSKKRYKNISQLMKLDNKNTIFIAGGDQLWNDFHPCGNDDSFKLLFVISGKKASFGTSLGRNNFKQSEIKMLRDKISDFEFLSVREKSSSIALSCQHVIDPVLLLDKSFYKESMITPKINEKYVVVYLVAKSQLLDFVIDTIRKNTEYKIVHVCGFVKKCDNDYFYKNTGPRELLGLIDGAELVISASFHATLFSIYLNKSFVSLLPNENTNARITELLEFYCLENRIVKEKQNFIDVFEEYIEYNEVNKKMNEFIKESKSFLNEELGKINMEKKI